MIMKHNCGPLIFLIFIALSNVTNGFSFGSLNLFASSESEFLGTREVLTDTGYWEYLRLLGLWGRVAHYLVTDTDAFGYHIKYLDRHYKSRFTAVKYVELQDNVVHSLPKFKILHKLKQMFEKIQNIRDDKTGKTLKDAFDILKKMNDSPECEKQFSEALGLVEDDALIPAKPGMKIDVIKQAILENPEGFAEVFKDPQIISYISGLVVQYIPNLDLENGVQALESTADHLETVYSTIYKEKIEPLVNIKDEKTDKTLAESLKSIMNIVKSKAFNDQVKVLLTDEAMKNIHAKSQDIIPKFIRGEKVFSDSSTQIASENVASSSGTSAPTINVPMKKTKPQASLTGPQFAQMLKLVGVDIDEEKATHILQLITKGQLIDEVQKFWNSIEERGETVSPKTIAEKMKRDGVDFSEEQIDDLLDMSSSFPPIMIVNILNQSGINIKLNDVEELFKYLEKLKPSQSSTSSFMDEYKDDDVSLSE